VRRATVSLNSQEPSIGRTAITDDNGQFVFTNLPPARYSLSASKRGWAGGSYGARAIGRPGRTLALDAGAHATATIRIARGAVISGTILDQFGQPMTGVTLRVMKYGYSFVSGERTLNPAGSAQSGPDERGA
jgi:protocatechuate 3,4-dioxygenase beta subunit